MNTSPACKPLSPACQRGESLIAIGDIINTIGHITYNSAHDQWPDGLTRGELTTAFDTLESAVAHARELHLGPVAVSARPEGLTPRQSIAA